MPNDLAETSVKLRTKPSRAAMLVVTAIGLALLGMSVVVLSCNQGDGACAGSLMIAGFGIMAVGVGLLHSEGYVEPEGLRRQRLLGTDCLEWRDIDCIELSERSSDSSRWGVIRVWSRRGKAWTFTTDTESVHGEATLLLRYATGAFLDDRIEGDIVPPAEGRREDIRRRGVQIANRSARYHRRLGAFTLAMAVIPVSVGILGLSGRIGPAGAPFALLGGAGCVVSVIFACRCFGKARRVRERTLRHLDDG